ncbi:MAG: hypothetical protein N3G20_11240 [Verrucomicrobiae bacterium]|nr:hypothetical protein [Verrucomicrobiae bacterium]
MNGNVDPELEGLVLAVHRRNGGTLTRLDREFRLLDPKLKIDSLDLAEIMVEVERRCGASPFDSTRAPRTWGDVSDWMQTRKTR